MIFQAFLILQSCCLVNCDHDGWDNRGGNLGIGGSRVRKTPLACWHCQQESFCAAGKFLRVPTKLTQNQVRTQQKSGKFQDCLEDFWKVSKVSGQSRKFLSRKVLNNLEGFQQISKVSGQPGKFLDNLEGLQPVWKRHRYLITWKKSLKLSTS